ncbi:hypothetical protein VPH35_059812 [Triticum aestivum]
MPRPALDPLTSHRRCRAAPNLPIACAVPPRTSPSPVSCRGPNLPAVGAPPPPPSPTPAGTPATGALFTAGPVNTRRRNVLNSDEIDRLPSRAPPRSLPATGPPPNFF